MRQNHQGKPALGLPSIAAGPAPQGNGAVTVAQQGLVFGALRGARRGGIPKLDHQRAVVAANHRVRSQHINLVAVQKRQGLDPDGMGAMAAKLGGVGVGLVDAVHGRTLPQRAGRLKWKKGGPKAALFDPKIGFGLCQSEIDRRLAAVTAVFDVEGHGLAVIQLADASTLDCRDVHEHIFATGCRGDKAETFGGVEPFHGAIGHRVYSCLFRHPQHAVARLRQNKIECLEPQRETAGRNRRYSHTLMRPFAPDSKLF